MSIVDDILGSINPEQLAGLLGTDPDSAMDAAAAAIPTLVGGLQANTGASGGAEGLASALGQHAGDKFGDQIDLEAVDAADGRKILNHALANDPERLAGVGGLDGDLLSKLLPILAPIVMNYLAKQLLGGGQNDTSAASNPIGDLLGGLLGGGAAPQTSSANPLGDLLGSMLGGASQPAPKAPASRTPASGGLDLGALLGQILGG